MNKHSVHDRKTRSRNYKGEAEAAPVLGWLNAKGGLLRQQAKAEMERGIELILFMYKFQPSVAHRKPSPEFQQVQRELNEWLLQYTFSNRLDCGDVGLVWSLRVNADLPRAAVRGEAEAVETIAELAKRGFLERIRKCKCGQYFFVRFPKREPPERFHSDQCRELFWESSEERKEQKQKWARNNYQSRKELELGSRKATQRIGGKK
jgi:hypothetical protein